MLATATGGNGRGGGNRFNLAFLFFPGDNNRRKKVRNWRMKLKSPESYLN
jgi:hypothetical protein